MWHICVMIQVMAYPPDLLMAHVMDIHGGQHMDIRLTDDLVDTINWVKQYKKQLDREQQIRSQDPVAQELYDQYRTYINLVA